MPRASSALYLFGFFSGFAAVLYQTVWLRRLSLIFGSSAVSVGICLGAFMAGLGLGSYLIGRAADRVRRPDRLYAWLETAIGAYGFLSPLIFEACGRLAPAAAAYAGQGSGGLMIAQAAGSFAIVLIPTFLMGGTYPAAVKYLSVDLNRRGKPIGLFYAANTFGAALAAFLFPVVLLESLGLDAVTWTAVICNLAAAIAAFAILPDLGRRRHGGETTRGGTASLYYIGGFETLWRDIVRCVGSNPAAGLAFLISGFAALGLETLYNRVLVMTFGSSIYSFAFILGVYLAGIGIGGQIFVMIERKFAARHIFAAAQGLVCAAIAVSAPWLDHASILHLMFMDDLGGTFAAFHVAGIMTTAAYAGVPAIAFGVGYPAALKWLTEGIDEIGDRTGFWSAVNGAGAFLGTTVTTFALMPAIGSLGCFQFLVSILALSVILILMPRRGEKSEAGTGWPRIASIASAAVAAAYFAAAPSWELRYFHALVGNSPSWALHMWRQNDFLSFMNAFDVRSYREGVEGTVSVLEFRRDGSAPPGDTRAFMPGRSFSLYVNGKADASNNFSDMVTQGMLAHLPMHVRPDARTALVVGLGSGMTAGTLASYPLETIDVVELSPDVVQAAREFFSDINNRVMEDSRVNLIVEDGRNFVARAGPAYDLIISEPSNAWLSGVSNLFTKEFFSAARKRIKPDGVFCQWFYSYSMSWNNIAIFLKTLQSEFPYVSVFNFSQARFNADLLILASARRIAFTPEMLSRLRPNLTAERYTYWLTSPNDLMRGFMIGDERLARALDGRPMHTDDRPLIELRGPKDLFLSTSKENLFRFVDAAPEITMPWTYAETELPEALGVEFAVDTPRFRASDAGIRVISFHDDAKTTLRRQAFKYAAWSADNGAAVSILIPLLGQTPAAAHRLTLSALAGVPVDHARRFDAGSESRTVIEKADSNATAVYAAWNCERSGQTIIARYAEPDTANAEWMQKNIGRWFKCR